MSSPLNKLHSLGQSIWLDFFDREVMDSGKLQKLIDDDQLAGITSNPSIFEKAILGRADYDDDIRKFAPGHSNQEDVFFDVAVIDIQRAADILKPVYEASHGTDGFVSLEVSPFLAKDEEGTVRQAEDLWRRLNRKNVMIKIPGTREGLNAIRRATAAGINVNVTLLFGLDRYKEVTNAYISGLEDRVKEGKSIEGIFSVASFFLSRIDVLLDGQLKEKGLNDLVGEVAIDSARMAYQIYLEVFNSDRFKQLQSKGANKQKVLWASTSTKDPSFSDVKYVEALIGPETINTLPLNTIDAFRDHGNAAQRLTSDIDKAKANLSKLENSGIDLKQVSEHLVEDGIEKFNKAFNQLLGAIKEKSSVVKAH